MTSRTVSGTDRRGAAVRGDDLGELAGSVPQVGLKHDAGRRAAAKCLLAEQLGDQAQRRLTRIERLHVDVEVSTELVRARQERPQPGGRILDPAGGSLGADERGQRRDLDGEVRARKRAVGVAIEQRARLELRVDPRERGQRLVAARRVGVGLRLGQRRFAQEVDRGPDPGAPEAPELALGLRGRGRRDEPVRHVADPAGNGGAQGEPARAWCRRPHGGGQRRRRLLDVFRELGEVRGEVVQAPAGGRYVDQAGRARSGAPGPPR